VSVEEHAIAGPYWFGAANDPFSPFDAPTEKAVSDPNEVCFHRICEDPKEITMPWTEITRKQYRREALRYASDMTDAEWALVKRLLPRATGAAA
jgi:hypothetical protein